MSPAAPKRGRKPRPQDAAEADRLDHALLKAAYGAVWDDAVAALMDGADIDATDPATGLTPLHLAVGTNNLPLVRLLVEVWGATFKPDSLGRWPSVVAARCGVDEDLADYIAEAEAKATNAE